MSTMFDFDTYHYEVVMRPASQGADVYYIRAVRKDNPSSTAVLCRLSLRKRWFGGDLDSINYRLSRTGHARRLFLHEDNIIDPYVLMTWDNQLGPERLIRVDMPYSDEVVFSTKDYSQTATS